MPFIRPTHAELAARNQADLEAALPAAAARLRHTAEGVLVRLQAMGEAELYGYVDWVAAQAFADTAEAAGLALHAATWGLARVGATPAEGSVTFTGADGTVVPAGTELRRADGVQVSTDAQSTVAGGTATAAVTATEAGAAGDTAAGTVLALTAPIAGLDAAATVAPDGSGGGLTGGADAEDDERLRARLLDRIRQPPHGGAAHDYVAWALAVPGVSHAWVRPLWMGAGSVGVLLLEDGEIPGQALLDTVAAAIDPVRPVTAEVYVVAPVPAPVDLTIELGAADTPAMRQAVEAALVATFARIAAPGASIKLAELANAVNLTIGEVHYALADLGVQEIAHAPAELPQLGAITWS